ncbi:MAG: glutathione S-transferase N-terminal domain-containing protein [Polyangiales bacterium]
MIQLYTWKTPNGRKVPIALEELGLPYEVRPVDLSKGEQRSPEFLRISPNNKIPAIVDDEGPLGPVTLFESGAILLYLADKTSKLLPTSGPARYVALEWLFWQVGGTGPMFGQLGHFAVQAKEKNLAAIERFTTECARLLGVIDTRLGEARFLGGDAYSIADIANYTWAHAATTYLAEPLSDALRDKGHLRRWLDEVGARPAVQRGMQIP